MECDTFPPLELALDRMDEAYRDMAAPFPSWMPPEGRESFYGPRVARFHVWKTLANAMADESMDMAGFLAFVGSYADWIGTTECSIELKTRMVIVLKDALDTIWPMRGHFRHRQASVTGEAA